ncbi:3-keto-disaccharide hydrolase [Maribacter sp. X9]|uniref:3-keto-disaccharide hydrolase n=1 Tax=Maribacter sp. X9 TaxID=3402159 RepID=UPI003AF34B1F
MKNGFFLTAMAVSIMAVSCQEKVKVDPLEGGTEIKNDSVIVYEEYSGTEPTTPEETEFYEPKVPVVKPGAMGAPPSDAIVLFDGTSLDNWISSVDSTAAQWHLNKDGSMTVNDKTGNIQTKQNFGDVQLHIEWKSPLPVQLEGQHRANSGIFLDGIYEVQVLDQNDNPTYVNGQVGSIYKQHVPLAMASVPTGEWNTYDIIYHAPEFNVDGGKIKSGDITVIHNGVLVQDHVEIKGTTPYIGWPKNPPHGKGPLLLQDHGDDSRVSYRNIWVREL